MVFPAIDILRGFAAVSVLVYHVIEHGHWNGFPTSGPLVWFRIGWIGVDIFLVISGFVISLSGMALLEKMGGSRFLRVFAERRLRRIVPLFYLTCFVFLVFVSPEILFYPNLRGHILTHALFLHNLFRDYAGSIDGPNWSVGLEMQFYVLFGFLAAPLLRMRVWKVAAAMFLISWLWRAAAIAMVPLDQPLGIYLRFQASTQLPGTLDEFGAGIVLARFIRGPHGARALALGQHYLPVLLALDVLLIWLMLHVYWLNSGFWDSDGMILLWRSACGAVVALTLFTACCCRSEPFDRVTRPLRYVGTIPYGIYLWHLPVLLSLKRVSGISAPQLLLLTMSATGILAAFSWHFFEKPLLRSRSVV